MFAIVSALGSIGSWIGGLLVAQFGYRVALAGAVLACYATVFAVIAGALAAVNALIPVNPFTAMSLQFFPDSWAVSTAATASLGTAAVVRSIEFWREAMGAVTRVA